MNLQKQLEVMNQQFKELTSIYRSATSQSGVSDNEFWLWYALIILKGEYSQQDICQMWFLPKQTVNSIISQLIKKELIYLETLPHTRNKKIIRLTKQGLIYGENIVMNVYQSECRALEKMSEEERDDCIQILSKYIHLLKEEINKNDK